jgi:CheY-like chemotaxis protein
MAVSPTPPEALVLETDTAVPGRHAPARDPGGARLAETRVLLAKARALELLAGPVRHELANSLSALSLFASVVELEGGVPDDMSGELRSAAVAAARVSRLTGLTLEVARTRPGGPQLVQIADLVADVAELAGSLLAEVDTDIAIPDELPGIEVDVGAARLAILLVVLGALRALGAPRARGHLRLEASVGPDGGTVELAVSDDARRPDATLTEDLAAARDLLGSNGGDLVAGALGGGGYRAVAVLPRERRAIEAQDASDPHGPPQAAPSASSLDTVLVCDDESSVRALLGRMLENAGMRALEAASGDEALAVLEREPVRLVIADQHMQQVLGTDLYAIVTERHPVLADRFVLMSGDPADAALVEFARAHRLPVLAKPFNLADVRLLLHPQPGASAPMGA